MHLERIALIPTTSRYETLDAFTAFLAQALNTLGNLEARIFPTTATPQHFFDQLNLFQPQALITFNSLFQVQGKLLCDHLKIPTLFYLLDAPFHFDEPNSPWASVACIDRGHCRYLEKEQFRRVLFLPHATPSSPKQTPQSPRSYDCVMLSSGINYLSIYQQLADQLPSSLFQQVEEAWHLFEIQPLITLDEALSTDLDLPPSLSRSALLQAMDLYLKGKARVEMLKSLPDISIDLFGGGDSWQEILGDTCPHVQYRGSLSFSQSIDILQQTKIVLNSCASVRDGAHERIFDGLSYGAAVATTPTPFLTESFQPNSGIACYPSCAQLNDKLQDWLGNESTRCQEVERGQQQVAAGHLWKHRAFRLRAALEAFLD